MDKLTTKSRKVVQLRGAVSEAGPAGPHSARHWLHLRAAGADPGRKKWN